MKKKILIKSPSDLSMVDLQKFCDRFRAGDYSIVVSDPVEDGLPDSMNQCFEFAKTYQEILDDPSASYLNHAISAFVDEERELLIPIGIFGESNKHAIRFPFILNGFWLMFLMANQMQFSMVSGITDPEISRKYFSRLVDMRKVFIEKIFSFYKSLDEEKISSMGWALRNKASLTRTLAEALGFQRKELFGQELYVSMIVSDEKYDYIYKCACRWVRIVDETSKYEAPFQVAAEITEFAKTLVSYESVVDHTGAV